MVSSGEKPPPSGQVRRAGRKIRFRQQKGLWQNKGVLSHVSGGPAFRPRRVKGAGSVRPQPQAIRLLIPKSSQATGSRPLQIKGLPNWSPAPCRPTPSLVGEAQPHESPSGLQVAWPSHLEKEPEETDPHTQTMVAAAKGLNYTTGRGAGCGHNTPGLSRSLAAALGPRPAKGKCGTGEGRATAERQSAPNRLHTQAHPPTRPLL